MSNITFTFTKSELEELLEETLREFVAYESLYGDDKECAISNTVAGAMQEVELNSAFASFGGREEFDAQVAEFQAFMDKEVMG